MTESILGVLRLFGMLIFFKGLICSSKVNDYDKLLISITLS